MSLLARSAGSNRTLQPGTRFARARDRMEMAEEIDLVHEEVTVQGGWGWCPRGVCVVFRSAKARPFAERKATLLYPSSCYPRNT